MKRQILVLFLVALCIIRCGKKDEPQSVTLLATWLQTTMDLTCPGSDAPPYDCALGNDCETYIFTSTSWSRSCSGCSTITGTYTVSGNVLTTTEIPANPGRSQVIAYTYSLTATELKLFRPASAETSDCALTYTFKRQ